VGKLIWLAQALTGGLLLVVLGLHMVANHTTEGLLTYEGALQRFHNPAILVLESVFLLVVVFHACNGLRNVIMDYVKSERAGRLATRILTAVGAVAAVYGLWLGFALQAR